MAVNSPSFSTQTINLEGVINARELGGYVLPGGKTVKRGLILRGGSLYQATDRDIALLRERYHLAHVFDFRTKGEVSMAPDREVPGADNIWLPAIDEKSEKLGENALPREAYFHLEDYVVEHCFDEMTKTVARSLYPEMVLNEYTQIQYAAFLQIISSTEEGAVYFHCSQGKDRTGLGAAFILCALGADRELIMQDYTISHEFYQEIVDELSAKVIARGGGHDELAVVRTFIGVNPEYFEDALDLIDMKFGSLENYVTNILMLSDEDKEKMRSRLLE